jgi:hypothetical protein
VMLWEALIGKRFAGGPELAEITKMHNRLTGGEPRVSQLRSDLPHALIGLCDRSLSLSPEERPPTALAFAREIDTYFQSAGVNPGAQQLADAMAPLFAKERDQLRKLIDQQMKAAVGPGVALDAGTHQLPMLPRQQYASGIWQAPPASSLAPAGQGGAAAGYGDPGLRSAPNTGSIGTPTSSRSHSINFQTSGLSIADRAFAAQPPARRVPWPAVVAFVVVAVSVGTFLAVRPGGSEAHAGAALPAPVGPALAQPAPAPGPAAAPPASVERAVRLAIRVDRADPEVTLDGARIRSLPFVGEVPRDSKVHTLEVSAPGRQSHREMLTYDRDLDLEVSLNAPASMGGAPNPVGRRRVAHAAPRAPEPAQPAPVAEAPAPPPPVAGVARAPENIEPGMDIQRLAPRRRNLSADVVLEEDPYQ